MVPPVNPSPLPLDCSGRNLFRAGLVSDGAAEDLVRARSDVRLSGEDRGAHIFRHHVAEGGDVHNALVQAVPVGAALPRAVFDLLHHFRIERRPVPDGGGQVGLGRKGLHVRIDKANTEDEVFHACEEAVQEIMDLIHRISVSGNTYHFIVTADHGFIYKRDKLTESDKISGKSADKAFVNRRFIVSKAALEDDGIDHMSMGRVLGNEDSKVVSYPVSSNVFKVAGGGANYVHGGSSPQEMLVPVLEFKMERGHMETKNAEIALVSIVHKITNLITSMDFIQSDAVSDTVKAAKYRIFFLSEDNEKISNENSYVADSREENAQKRIFRMRFTFKNKKYDKDKQYYLVVYDEESGLEQWRQPVIMDIAFADDFGFGF